MKFIKKAFTLAEVVMVMGIIGIVATLTVTNATKSTDVAEKVAQLRRCDEIISAAFAQAVGDYGPLKNWASTAGSWPTNNEIWTILSSYLKLQKNCKNSTGCWTNAEYGDTRISSYDGGANLETSTSHYKGILPNGASICINGTAIYVDVNGKDKGTFRRGDDVFKFYVDSDGVVTPHRPSGGGYGVNDIKNCTRDDGSYCTAWVLKFGNQDYMKSCAESKLSWDGAHSCKE